MISMKSTKYFLILWLALAGTFESWGQNSFLISHESLKPKFNFNCAVRGNPIPIGGSITLTVYSKERPEVPLYRARWTSDDDLTPSAYVKATDLPAVDVSWICNNNRTNFNCSSPERKAKFAKAEHIAQRIATLEKLIYIGRTQRLVEPGHPVNIELTLNNVVLGDICGVSIAGISGELTASNFVKKGYTSEHHCSANEETPFCQRATKIRTVDLSKEEDIQIAAHRGVWGEYDNENTISAFIAAKNFAVTNTQHIFLVESDLVPYGPVNLDSTHSDFLKPQGLVCSHDFPLERFADFPTDSYVFNLSRSQIEGKKVRKPRSFELSSDNIMFFDELLEFVKQNDMMVCADVRELYPRRPLSSTGEALSQVCEIPALCVLDKGVNKQKSLAFNVKNAIETARSSGALKNLIIKTYYSYTEVRRQLVDVAGMDQSYFNKILWIPMLSPNNSFLRAGSTTDYDPRKFQLWLDGWFAHNDAVLYYETNFRTDTGNQTGLLCQDVFPFFEGTTQKWASAMEYIVKVAGRRPGIFGEEPIGSKGVVDRWGRWILKYPADDRRTDHIWLFTKPFMKYAVYTTDRPDIWKQFKNN